MKLIKYFFDCRSDYVILKHKYSVQLCEVKKELGFKPMDTTNFILSLYAGILIGSSITWIGYFIFN